MERGRPPSSKRRFVEDCIAIDVRSLTPLESTPALAVMRLDRGGSVPMSLPLTVTFRNGDCSNLTVFTTTTRPNYGRTRRWFLCTCCGRRAGKLYGRHRWSAFACRLCLRLVYRSQYSKDPDLAFVRRWVLNPPSMAASARRQRATRLLQKLSWANAADRR